MGKIANIDEQDQPIEWTLTGFLDSKSRERICSSKLWLIVQRFLVLHRGHELCALSEAFLLDVDPEGYLTYIDEFAEIFCQTVNPEPDDEADALRVPDSVRATLARKVRHLRKL